MGGLLAFFAGPAKLKALLVGAMAMIIVCLALTGWALLERSWRLSCEVDRVVLQAQVAVLADSLNRQNDGIDKTVAAGTAAQAGVQALLEAAEKLGASGRNLARKADQIVTQPTPKRPDGKSFDCADAWREIEGRAKP